MQNIPDEVQFFLQPVLLDDYLSSQLGNWVARDAAKILYKVTAENLIQMNLFSNSFYRERIRKVI